MVEIASAISIIAPFTIHTSPSYENVKVSPWSVVSTNPSDKSAEVYAPGTTWYVSTFVKSPLFSGSRRVSTVPSGNASKAEFVGANTVNGPSHLSASTRSAAVTAATSVVWSAEFTALSTISFDGTIIAPPIITHSSCIGSISSILSIESIFPSDSTTTMSSFVPIVVSVIPSLQDASNTEEAASKAIKYFVFINWFLLK